MVKIEIGGEYVAAKAATGDNDGKPWEMLVVKDTNPKGRKEVKVWATNHPGISTGDHFRVDSISSVKSSARKYNEKWIDEVHVEAEVSPLMSYAQFTEMSGDNDELPF
jgi:hypothetical protein